MSNWENATPFENQEELSEPERFYMNGLVRRGFEVRFDDVRIYNLMSDGTVFSFLRRNLQQYNR